MVSIVERIVIQIKKIITSSLSTTQFVGSAIVVIYVLLLAERFLNPALRNVP